MKLILKLVALFSFLTLAGLPAQFQNGSFESGSTPDRILSAADPSITGWIVLPDNIDWVSGLNYPFSASHGRYFLDLNGCCSGTGGIQQTFDSISGNMYIVTFDMNSNNNPVYDGLFPKLMRVSADGVSQDFVYTPQVLSSLWESQTFAFTATSGQTTLTFQSLVPNSAVGPLLDNVRISDIPEPASFLLVGTGFVLCTILTHHLKRLR